MFTFMTANKRIKTKKSLRGGGDRQATIAGNAAGA